MRRVDAQRAFQLLDGNVELFQAEERRAEEDVRFGVRRFHFKSLLRADVSALEIPLGDLDRGDLEQCGGVASIQFGRAGQGGVRVVDAAELSQCPPQLGEHLRAVRVRLGGIAVLDDRFVQLPLRGVLVAARGVSTGSFGGIPAAGGGDEQRQKNDAFHGSACESGEKRACTKAATSCSLSCVAGAMARTRAPSDRPVLIASTTSQALLAYSLATTRPRPWYQ